MDGDAIAEEEHRCCFNSLNFRIFCLFVLVIDAYVLLLGTFGYWHRRTKWRSVEVGMSSESEDKTVV